VNSKHRAARLERCASIPDVRKLARRRLPRPLFDFVDGGAGAETTLREDEHAFARLRLLPRYPVDVSRRSTPTTILGYNASTPLILAPVGFAGPLFPDGELGAARAAANAAIPFRLSTNSLALVEENGTYSESGERWSQLYFLKDRAWMQTLCNARQPRAFVSCA
jgi:isopentenyl diphosphate isomerase/L-lactate dehydrogenase-like FMN-dependent dehydrogenase